MGNLTFIVGVVVLTPHYIERVLEARDIDEAHINRKDRGPHDQPGQYEGNVDPPDVYREEDDGFHHGRDGLKDCL